MAIQFHNCKIEGDWENAARAFIDRMTPAFDELADELTDPVFTDAVVDARASLKFHEEILNKLLQFGAIELNTTDKLKKQAGLPTRDNDNEMLSALGLVNFEGCFFLPKANSRNWEEIQNLYHDIGKDFTLLKEILNGDNGVLLLVKKDPIVSKVLSPSGLVLDEATVSTRLGRTFTQADVTYQERTKTAYASEAKFTNLNSRSGPINTSLYVLGAPEFTIARINNLQNLGLTDLRLAAAVNDQSLELLALSTLTTKLQAVISTLQGIDKTQSPALIGERVAVAKEQYLEAFVLTAHTKITISEPHLITFLESRLTEDVLKRALDDRTDIVSINMAATATQIREAITLVISSNRNRTISAALRNPEIDRKDQLVSDSFTVLRSFAFVEDLLAETFFKKPGVEDESVHDHSDRLTDFGDDGSPAVQIDFPATDGGIQALILELGNLLVLVQETSSGRFTNVTSFGLAQDGVTSVPITNIGFRSNDTPNQLVDRNLDFDATLGIRRTIAGMGNLLVNRDGDVTNPDGSRPNLINLSGDGCFTIVGPQVGQINLVGDWVAIHSDNVTIIHNAPASAPRAPITNEVRATALDTDTIVPCAQEFDSITFDIPSETDRLILCGRGGAEVSATPTVTLNINSFVIRYPAPFGQPNVIVDFDLFIDLSDLLDFEISLGGLGVMLEEGLTRMIDAAQQMQKDLNVFLQELSSLLTLSLNLQGEVSIDLGLIKCSLGINWSPTLSLVPLLGIILDALLFVNSLLQTLFNIIRQVLCLPICILDSVLNLGPTSFPGGLAFCQISLPNLPTNILDLLRELQDTMNFALTLQNFKSSQFSSGLIPSLRALSNGWLTATLTSCDCPSDTLTGLF